MAWRGWAIIRAVLTLGLVSAKASGSKKAKRIAEKANEIGQPVTDAAEQVEKAIKDKG